MTDTRFLIARIRQFVIADLRKRITCLRGQIADIKAQDLQMRTQLRAALAAQRKGGGA